jgi:hypothetical protein
MFFVNLFKEIWTWRRIWSIGKKNSEYLTSKKIRRDFYGRLYTVINLPEEIAGNEFAREPYILDKLREYDEILLKLGLAEEIYPEFELIPNSDSYLLVMEGDTEYLKFWKIVYYLALYFVFYKILAFIYSILEKNHIIDAIVEFVKKYI